jgi:heme exporter protein B
MFFHLVRRDLALIARSPAVWMPVMFFVLVAALFPFAVGPDARLLARIAPGILWVSALLAALLPVETLLAPDMEDGTLDQLASRGIAMETVALDAAQGWRLALALLVGTPALAALAVVAAALTAGLRGGGALAGLIVLPLALPVLIFGVGAEQAGALRLLAAASLVSLAVAPFAAGAALKQE